MGFLDILWKGWGKIKELYQKEKSHLLLKKAKKKKKTTKKKKIMKGHFIIRDNDKILDTEYNEVDDIPQSFDKVIRFATPTSSYKKPSLLIRKIR